MKSIDISKVMLVFVVMLIAFSIYLGFKGFSLENGLLLLNPFIGFAIFVIFGFILPAAWKLPASMRSYLRYLLIVSSLLIILSLFFNIINGQYRLEAYSIEFVASLIVTLLYIPLFITLLFKKAWYPLSLLAMGLSNVFGFLLYIFPPHGLMMGIFGLILYFVNSIVSGDIAIFSKLIDLLSSVLPFILTIIIQHIVYLGYVGLLFLLGFMALAEKEKGGFLTIGEPVMEKLNRITVITIQALILLHLISILLSVIVSPDSLPYSLLGIWGEGLKWIGL